MSKRYKAGIAEAVFGLTLLFAQDAAAITVRLSSSVPPPAAVGTKVTFHANISGASGSQQWYRFRVRRQGGNYQMLRAFGPVSSLEWTASVHEGTYELEVSVRDLGRGDTATDSTLFDFSPIVTGKEAVVTPTSNSLVFLYSAPACPDGQRMRVVFRTPEGPAQQTPFLKCNGLTMNFYLAGMRAETTYKARYTIDTGTLLEVSRPVEFTTGALPDGAYTSTILAGGGIASKDDILLGSPLGGPAIAHDLDGNVLWYGPVDMSLLTRIEDGGLIWGLVEHPGLDPSNQLLRKIDLAGMTLLETNAGIVNSQLAAMGKRQITGFHHEARPLKGGRIATLGYIEQIMTDVQGSGPIDILGDMVIVLDKDLNVVWAWDAFDHLDVRRAAVLGEKCPQVCPQPVLAATANDWTHSNAIQETPDGHLLVSSRHQDWLIKIDFNNANGDGHVIWRMGPEGDFTIASNDAFPWFSHQHDANFDDADPTKLSLFDDGNTRVDLLKGGNSRGQVMQVDEENRVVTPVLNADLGVYSFALGSAQKLRSGNYHFDAGFVNANGGATAYSIEVDAEGNIVYNANASRMLYRSFRLKDLYSIN